jgi:hypothetical protein
MSEFTKGPWKAEFEENGGYDCMTDAFKITAADETIAVIDQMHYGQATSDGLINKQAQANAALIAAAPEMYEALKQLLKSNYGQPSGVIIHVPALNIARAALSKAESKVE